MWKNHSNFKWLLFQDVPLSAITFWLSCSLSYVYLLFDEYFKRCSYKALDLTVFSVSNLIILNHLCGIDLSFHCRRSIPCSPHLSDFFSTVWTQPAHLCPTSAPLGSAAVLIIPVSPWTSPLHLIYSYFLS